MTPAPGPPATTISTLTARVHAGPKGIRVCILDVGDVHTEGVVCACMRAWRHVCACVCTAAHAHTHACLHMRTQAHVCLCVLCTSVHECMHIHVGACVCVSVRGCTHVCAVRPAPMSMLPGVYGPGKEFLLFQSHHSAIRIGEAQPTHSRCCISLSPP